MALTAFVVWETAKDAYNTAMSTAFTGAAAGVLGAAVVALLVMRGRKPTPAAEPDPVLVG